MSDQPKTTDQKPRQFEFWSVVAGVFAGNTVYDFLKTVMLEIFR